MAYTPGYLESYFAEHGSYPTGYGTNNTNTSIPTLSNTINNLNSNTSNQLGQVPLSNSSTLNQGQYVTNPSPYTGNSTVNNPVPTSNLPTNTEPTNNSTSPISNNNEWNSWAQNQINNNQLLWEQKLQKNIQKNAARGNINYSPENTNWVNNHNAWNTLIQGAQKEFGIKKNSSNWSDLESTLRQLIPEKIKQPGHQRIPHNRLNYVSSGVPQQTQYNPGPQINLDPNWNFYSPGSLNVADANYARAGQYWQNMADEMGLSWNDFQTQGDMYGYKPGVSGYYGEGATPVLDSTYGIITDPTRGSWFAPGSNYSGWNGVQRSGYEPVIKG